MDPINYLYILVEQMSQDFTGPMGYALIEKANESQAVQTAYREGYQRATAEVLRVIREIGDNQNGRPSDYKDNG